MYQSSHLCLARRPPWPNMEVFNWTGRNLTIWWSIISSILNCHTNTLVCEYCQWKQNMDHVLFIQLKWFHFYKSSIALPFALYRWGWLPRGVTLAWLSWHGSKMIAFRETLIDHVTTREDRISRKRLPEYWEIILSLDFVQFNSFFDEERMDFMENTVR